MSGVIPRGNPLFGCSAGRARILPAALRAFAGMDRGLIEVKSEGGFGFRVKL